ncbi:uncharacterized protein LOC133285277 [Gastrolobium bilobum]|uniref:uncharacterized protein LOC133285277 n=1 Tax=Gastrolobium bilobum TaxID=150636 RepID=UPI002AB26700|nr:uncharacterized protein LOC133285277 [Gastrolobium bilobum]
MKLSAKPISSPGRTDKFPPPLMRFLRSNAGSKSRGRSRSSPMFVRKKNNTAIETQEPSSPKVTCMGQVRVRRSSKQPTAKRDRAPTRCRCWWIRKPNTVWPKWGFFRVGSFRRKATKLKKDSVKSESNFQGRSNDEDEDEESVYEERVNAFASNSCTPPRNALLLTRCRSAPYRSSSLASRFWGSPLMSEETEQRTELENSESTSTDNEKPSSPRESISDQEGKRDPETEPKSRFFKELEDSLRERIAKSKSVEVAASPVVLTRCKSEPARTGHRLDPEVNNLLKKRRLGLHMISD